jgi:hypothetical protein
MRIGGTDSRICVLLEHGKFFGGIRDGARFCNLYVWLGPIGFHFRWPIAFGPVLSVTWEPGYADVDP